MCHSPCSVSADNTQERQTNEQAVGRADVPRRLGWAEHAEDRRPYSILCCCCCCLCSRVFLSRYDSSWPATISWHHPKDDKRSPHVKSVVKILIVAVRSATVLKRSYAPNFCCSTYCLIDCLTDPSIANDWLIDGWIDWSVLKDGLMNWRPD